MNLLSGKELSAKIRQSIKDEIMLEYLQNGKEPPTLAVVLVGNDLASEIYVRNKERACEEVGMRSRTVKLPENSSLEEIKMQ